MRTYIIILLMCCSLIVPALAAESPEALSKRVTELENANLVLHEALAQNRIALDEVIEALQQTLTALEAKNADEHGQVQTTLTHAKASLETTQQSLETTQKSLEATQASVEKTTALLSTTKANLEDSIAALQQQLSQGLATRDELEQKIAAIGAERKDELAAQKALLANVEASINNTKASLASRVAELEKVNFVLHEAIARNRIDMEESMDALQESIADATRELQDTIANLQQQLHDEMAMRAALEDTIANTKNASAEDLAAQKALLARLDESIAKTQKTLQGNIDTLLSLLSKEVALRVAQSNDAAANANKLQDNIAGLLGVVSKNVAVQATQDEFRNTVTSLQQLLDQEAQAREALAKAHAAKADALAERIAKLEAGMAEMAARPAPVAVAAPAPRSERDVLDPDKLDRVEIARLRIVNTANGEISASSDDGAAWHVVGHVVTPAEKSGNEEFARTWAPVGVIAATAIDGVAVRTGYDETAHSGQVFAILPKLGTRGSRAARTSLDARAAIQTDIVAGDSIFGDAWTPIQGSPVFLETSAGLQQIPAGFVPKKGDVFVIRVMQAKRSPQAYVFENKAGGSVTTLGWDGNERKIGQVLAPVRGIDRFADTASTDVGRLSASLNGVLEFSVSSVGQVGGFRIMLNEQQMSADALRASNLPSYMVVAEDGARSPSWEGLAPLFMGALRPRWSEKDWESKDWLRLITARAMVEVRIDGGSWQSLEAMSVDPDTRKPLPESAKKAFEHVTHIRVHVPVPPPAK